MLPNGHRISCGATQRRSRAEDYLRLKTTSEGRRRQCMPLLGPKCSRKLLLMFELFSDNLANSALFDLNLSPIDSERFRTSFQPVIEPTSKQRHAKVLGGVQNDREGVVEADPFPEVPLTELKGGTSWGVGSGPRTDGLRRGE